MADQHSASDLRELPYHRWPRSYGGWQAGSIIRCEGDGCRFCAARWNLVDPKTLEEVKA